jgi:uncharacterized protein
VKLIVSDTSPIVALAHLGRLDLLWRAAEETLIPAAVAEELAAGGRNRPGIEVSRWVSLRVVTLTDRAIVDQLGSELDLGEAEAIALACQTPGAVLLIDETAGREEARRRGLAFIGVLGLILQAKRNGQATSVTELMDRLREELQFHISDELYAEL